MMRRRTVIVLLLFICVEGISQAEMLAFLFDAAHEREKFAKHASHRYHSLEISR